MSHGSSRTSDSVLNRLVRLREELARRQVPALLVSDVTNLRWVTGFTGSHGFALVTDREAWLAVDSRYTLQAVQQAPHMECKRLTSSGSENLAALITETVCGDLAIEADRMTVAAYDDLRRRLDGTVRIVSQEGIIRGLRVTKDATEIDSITRACRIVDDVFAYMCGIIKPGISERDVMLELEWRIRKHHGAEVAFPSIVVSGPRSAMPHGTATERVLENGDLVTLDFGARVDGYCSDITRTIVLGSPSSEQRRVYLTVLEAQQRAIAAIRPGAAGKDVDNVARGFIADAGHGDHFGHGLGHSIGLDVHDGPGMSPTGENVLAESMVVTVEPGIYIPDWGGIRIEDDVLVTSHGPQTLTSAERGLLSL